MYCLGNWLVTVCIGFIGENVFVVESNGFLSTARATVFYFTLYTLTYGSDVHRKHMLLKQLEETMRPFSSRKSMYQIIHILINNIDYAQQDVG